MSVVSHQLLSMCSISWLYQSSFYHNFFAQVMRVSLTCIVGSVYSSRFLVLLRSAYSLSLWRTETTDFKDTFQEFRLTAQIMNRSIAFHVLATLLIFLFISCAQKETWSSCFPIPYEWNSYTMDQWQRCSVRNTHWFILWHFRWLLGFWCLRSILFKIGVVRQLLKSSLFWVIQIYNWTKLQRVYKFFSQHRCAKLNVSAPTQLSPFVTFSCSRVGGFETVFQE